MPRFAMLIAAAGVAVLQHLPAGAATIEPIDCARDFGVAERAICRSQSLQILDAKITEAYADLMTSRRVSADAKFRLRQSQYDFLDRRDACGADRFCLEEVMNRRLSRIYNYL